MRSPVEIRIAVPKSPLIRHGFAVLPYPVCPFGTFPPDRGNRPSPRGRLAGDRKGRPYGGSRTRSVGSAKPGAVFEPQQF